GHEKGENQDGEQDGGGDGDAAHDLEGARAEPGDALLELLLVALDPVVDLVLLDQVPDRPPPGAGVGHVPGEVVGEMLDLVQEGPDEGVQHAAEKTSADEEHDERRQRTPEVKVALHPIDGWREHDREEGGDEENGLDASEGDDQPKADDEGKDDADGDDDRAHRHRTRTVVHPRNGTEAPREPCAMVPGAVG